MQGGREQPPHLHHRQHRGLLVLPRPSPRAAGPGDLSLQEHRRLQGGGAEEDRRRGGADRGRAAGEGGSAQGRQNRIQGTRTCSPSCPAARPSWRAPTPSSTPPSARSTPTSRGGWTTPRSSPRSASSTTPGTRTRWASSAPSSAPRWPTSTERGARRHAQQGGDQRGQAGRHGREQPPHLHQRQHRGRGDHRQRRAGPRLRHLCRDRCPSPHHPTNPCA
jgi:hypothetical protein